jgi:hypothetical protein
VVRLTQGSPPGLTLKAAIDVKKPIPIRRTRSGEGSEGGRFTDSTDDLGPEKPGNRVEGKTLTTRKLKDETHSKPGFLTIVGEQWEAVDGRRR